MQAAAAAWENGTCSLYSIVHDHGGNVHDFIVHKMDFAVLIYLLPYKNQSNPFKKITNNLTMLRLKSPKQNVK